MSEYPELLKSIVIFNNLDEPELSLVSSICSEKEFAGGEVVFIEQTEGDELFIILEGEVSISLEMADAEDAMPLVNLKTGDIFGELAIVDEALRSATAVCLTDCRFLTLRKGDLDELMDGNHTLGYKVMRNLAGLVCERIRRTNQRILDNVSWGMI